MGDDIFSCSGAEFGPSACDDILDLVYILFDLESPEVNQLAQESVFILHKPIERKLTNNCELELLQWKATKARTVMQNHSQVPLDHEDTTSIIFDSMETLPTPVLFTGITYNKHQLWTYCLGIHTSLIKMTYVQYESVASRGPEEILPPCL